MGSRLLNLLVGELIFTHTKCMMVPKIKKCKVVTKNVTKLSIQFDDYRECLFSRKEQHRKNECHTKSLS